MSCVKFDLKNVASNYSRKLALFGSGGHAREVAAQIGQPVTFYVTDELADGQAEPVSKFDPNTEVMLVAIGESILREKIIESLPNETVYFTYIHPTAQILDSNIVIGAGSFIGANCILTTNIRLGKHALLNRNVQVGHDCVIGDYFSAMPGAIIGGNVMIGNNVYLGSMSNLRDKVSILANNVKVGMNAAVVNDIHESGVYIGVPARKH